MTDLQRLYEEDLAAARAAAEMNAMVREAELEAAEALLNNMSGEADGNSALDAAMTPDANLLGAEDDEAAATARLDVPEGYALTRDGQLVDVNRMIASVKEAQAKGDARLKDSK